MNIFDLSARITLDSTDFENGITKAQSTAHSFGGLMSGAFQTVAKVGAVAMTTVGAGVAAFSKIVSDSVGVVGELEQNIGGIETLFGTQGAKSVEEYAQMVGKSVNEVKDEFETLSQAQSVALENANNAYKTAGLSANEYMQQVTSFAAALKQSTENEYEAAKAADQMVIDMSDNANKMGTDIQSIQNAYQGFAKQNYTMLDNLKLGYGGTKGEMERLLADAEKISGVKYDIDSLNDVGQAIHVIQTELGITGTTAKEAASTIQGSMASAKAAWENFLAGTASADDFGSALSTAATVLVDNLMEIIPRLSETLPQIISIIAEQVPPLLAEVAPVLIEGGVNLIVALGQGIMESIPTFLENMKGVLDSLKESFTANAPALMETGAQLLQMLWDGIMNGLPMLADGAIQIISSLTEGIKGNGQGMIEAGLQALMDFTGSLRENVGNIVDSGIELIVTLGESLIAALPELIKTVPQIIINICGIINDNAPKLLMAGLKLLVELGKGIIQAVPTLIQEFPKIIEAIVAIWSAFNWLQLGSNLIKSVKDGVMKLAKDIPNAMKGIGDKAVQLFRGINWSGLGSNVIEIIVNGVKSLITLIPNTLKTIGMNALTAFKNIDWLGVGKSVVEGIIKGVASMAGAAIGALKDLAGKMIDGAKKVLGINSPSKIFRQIGEFCIEGLEQPFDDFDSSDLMGNLIPDMGNIPTMGGYTMAMAGAGGMGIDYDLLGESIAHSIQGLSMTMDGRVVGQLIAPDVDIALGRINRRRT